MVGPGTLFIVNAVEITERNIVYHSAILKSTNINLHFITRLNGVTSHSCEAIFVRYLLDFILCALIAVFLVESQQTVLSI